MDGELVSPEDAKIALHDRGYQVGLGAFATLRAYEGRCFRLADHILQLQRAAGLLGLSIRADAGPRANEAAAKCGAKQARVRMTVTETMFSIIAEELIPPSTEDYENGVAAAVVTPRRIPPACFDGTIKSTSYAPSILAQREAQQLGAAEGIQLAIDGSVACGTVSNVFMVKGDVLSTPSLETGCRAGVTRKAVMELAEGAGLRAEERPITIDELLAADEAFFTSSRIEILPIATLDGKPIPNRTRTHALLEAFRALVQKER